MFSINLKRSVMTLAVVAGLLAAAGPASAQVLPGMVGFTTPSPGPGPQVAGSVIVPDPELSLLKVASRPDDHIFVAGHDTTHTNTQSREPARTITMLDYEGTPVVTHSPKDSPQAYMTDVIWQGYANRADSNEVAVEGITLAHEGFEIQAVGTRSGGEVISSDAY
jgi:hypothetical protein